MFGPKSLEYPSPGKLIGRMFRSSVYLATIGAAASIALVGLEGDLCPWLGDLSTLNHFACASDQANIRLYAAFSIMLLYLTYLLAGPVLHGHNRIVLYSHETAWVHAVANWVGRLTGGINPMTPGWSDVAKAAIEVNHAYHRHNLVTFLLIILGTLLYAAGIFSPWFVASQFSAGLYTTAMIMILAVVYAFVATAFIWIALRVLTERRHKNDEEEAE